MATVGLASPSNNSGASDGIKIWAVMQKLSAAADQERCTETIRPLKLSISRRN